MADLLNREESEYEQNTTLFEIDMETLKQLSEILAYRLLDNLTSESYYLQFQGSILTYLGSFYSISEDLFDTSTV